MFCIFKKALVYNCCALILLTPLYGVDQSCAPQPVHQCQPQCSAIPPATAPAPAPPPPANNQNYCPPPTPQPQPAPSCQPQPVNHNNACNDPNHNQSAGHYNNNNQQGFGQRPNHGGRSMNRNGSGRKRPRANPYARSNGRGGYGENDYGAGGYGSSGYSGYGNSARRPGSSMARHSARGNPNYGINPQFDSMQDPGYKWADTCGFQCSMPDISACDKDSDDENNTGKKITKLNNSKKENNNNLFKEVNDKDFDDDVLDESENKPVVVYSYLETCPNCQKMKPILREIPADLSKRYKFVQIDGEKNRKFTQKYKVTAFPTFIIFNDEKEKKRTIGAMDGDAFYNWLRS